MTSLTSFASCTRRCLGPFQLRTMIALGATLVLAPTSVIAGAQVQGNPEAVRIEAQNSSIEEVLAALGDAFDLRYRSPTKLAKQLSGTYQGSLQRVVARVLDGYDFVIRSNKGKIEITVLGMRNAAPAAAVASSASAPSKTAPVAPGSPASPTLPSKATERPAPPPAPALTKVAEGPIGAPTPESGPAPVPGLGPAPFPEPGVGVADVAPPMPIPTSGPAPFPEPAAAAVPAPESGSTPVPAPGGPGAPAAPSSTKGRTTNPFGSAPSQRP